MKSRGIFVILAAMLAAVGTAFRLKPSPNTSGRMAGDRQAFYAVSGGHRANQRKNYKKGWVARSKWGGK